MRTEQRSALEEHVGRGVLAAGVVQLVVSENGSARWQESGFEGMEGGLWVVWERPTLSIIFRGRSSASPLEQCALLVVVHPINTPAFRDGTHRIVRPVGVHRVNVVFSCVW
jgi:hypothetical protein